MKNSVSARYTHPLKTFQQAAKVFDTNGRDFSFFISEVAEKTVTWRFSQLFWRWVKKTRKRDEL
jgi:hypothetical protein